MAGDVAREAVEVGGVENVGLDGCVGGFDEGFVDDYNLEGTAG